MPLQIYRIAVLGLFFAGWALLFQEQSLRAQETSQEIQPAEAVPAQPPEEAGEGGTTAAVVSSQGAAPEKKPSIIPADIETVLAEHPQAYQYFVSLIEIVQLYQQENIALGESYFERLEAIENPQQDPIAVFEQGVSYAKQLGQLNRTTAESFEALTPPAGFIKSHTAARALGSMMSRMQADCEELAAHYAQVVKPSFGTEAFLPSSQQFITMLQSMNARYPAELTALLNLWQQRFLDDLAQQAS